MTDKELLKQAYDALDKITDMFDAVNGRCVMGGDDIYDFAIQAMMQLDERLKQEQPKTNQCAETCERAKLCAVCGVSLNQEQGAVVWMYTNAQGKEVIVKADVAPYEDAVPLYTAPQPETKPWVGLTDEEIEKIIDADDVYMKYIGSGEHVSEGEYQFARNIEAKLKELNK